MTEESKAESGVDQEGSTASCIGLWEYLRDEIALAKKQRGLRRDRSCGAVHLGIDIAEAIADVLEQHWRESSARSPSSPAPSSETPISEVLSEPMNWVLEPRQDFMPHEDVLTADSPLLRTPSRGSEEELGKLLDITMKAFWEESGAPMCPLEMPNYRAARQSVESYVSRLRDEIERLRAYNNSFKATIEELRHSEAMLGNKLSEISVERIRESASLKEQQRGISESTLTEEIRSQRGTTIVCGGSWRVWSDGTGRRMYEVCSE